MQHAGCVNHLPIFDYPRQNFSGFFIPIPCNYMGIKRSNRAFWPYLSLARFLDTYNERLIDEGHVVYTMPVGGQNLQPEDDLWQRNHNTMPALELHAADSNLHFMIYRLYAFTSSCSGKFSYAEGCFIAASRPSWSNKQINQPVWPCFDISFNHGYYTPSRRWSEPGRYRQGNAGWTFQIWTGRTGSETDYNDFGYLSVYTKVVSKADESGWWSLKYG